MTTDVAADSAYLAERKTADERRYLIRSMDPDVAPRLAPAVRAVHEHLADGRALAWDSVIAVGLRSSDLTLRTVSNTLRKLIAHGFVVREGKYSRAYVRGHWRVSDTRTVRMGDWPLSTEGD